MARNWIEGAIEVYWSRTKGVQGSKGDRAQGNLASMVGARGDVVELRETGEVFLV